MFAEPVINESIGVVERVEPNGIVASSGHTQKCGRNGGAAGAAFRAADIDIRNRIRKDVDKLDYRLGVNELERSFDVRVFHIKKTKFEFVHRQIIEILVFPACADDDRISFRRKIERTLIDTRIECRDRQNVDRVLFYECVHDKSV